MRDMLAAAILAVFVVWALRRPWIGAMAWTAVSLGSPHVQLAYAAATWPVGLLLALATLAGLLFSQDRQQPFVGPAVGWLLAFVVGISLTLPFSISVDASYGLWERSIKIFLMLFVTLTLVTDRRKLEVFIWVCVASVGYYGVKGGLFTLLTGGNHRVWGPGGFIEGNNEVALAVITVVPLMRYLQMQMQNNKLKLAMTGAMALCVITALGTYSRGALVGLAAMGAFFWLKGKSKFAWGIGIAAVGVLALSFMPEQWWARMDTIKSYDADASALGRINAWWMAFNLAQDRLFGGGFMIYTREVFARYAPIPDDVHAAHSIYFQVLGEHGFIGLFLFLSIGVATWLCARSLIRLGRTRAELNWAANLGAMIQVSMIGYGAAGTFLSLAYYDLPYNVMVMAVLGLKFAHQQQLSLAMQETRPPSVAVQTLTPQLRY